MEKVKKPLGRPPKLVTDRLQQRSIRLSPAQWAKIDAMGLRAFREIIEVLPLR